MSEPEISTRVEQMKRDWDARARENARWFINIVKYDQTDEEFDATGKPEVEKAILSDPVFIEGRDLKDLRLLEIGCGIGRMTRHLSRIFGEVYGVDVSAEMIAQGKERLADCANVHLYETSGVDFAPLADDYFDRAFSVYVFQHVPDAGIIRANIKDALRVLKPGGLFKFHVNGFSDEEFEAMPKDTWTGVAFSEAEIRRAAREFGAQLVSLLDAGTLRCWTILRKPLARDNEHPLAPQIEYFGRADDPQSKQIPTSGIYAYLTLVLSGIAPERADANAIDVEVAGRRIAACYSGFIGDNYVAALDAAGMSRSRHLTQANFPIPADLPPGRHSVRVWVGEREVSMPVEIEFLAPQPVPPRIYYASNTVDGGVDIHARGAKSRFRVFVHDLERGSDRESVSLYIDGERVEIAEMKYIPAGGYFELIAQLPPDIEPGKHEIIIESRGLRSLPSTFEALP